MATTTRKPLPPRPFDWTMKPLGSAETALKTLPDGRLELTIRHDVLRGVTPAMLGWWFRNIEGTMEHKGRTRLSSGVWASALEKEDELAIHLIDRAIEVLGAGIASVVNLLDLEAIVVGGGLGTRLGQPYADRIADAMRPHLLVPDRAPSVHTAALGDLGGAIGGALLAKEMSHVAQVSGAEAL